MDYGYSEKRNKRKGKVREKKKNPYKTGGAQRSMNVSSNSENSNPTNPVKKKKKSKGKKK